jgi:hypothetical protein
MIQIHRLSGFPAGAEQSGGFAIDEGQHFALGVADPEFRLAVPIAPGAVVGAIAEGKAGPFGGAGGKGLKPLVCDRGGGWIVGGWAIG